MSAKFTPGPWVLDSDDHPFEPAYHFIEAGCGFTGGKNPGFCLSGCMTIDDARLITAAPDLLEALQWCVSQGWVRYTSRIKGQNDQYCDAVDKIHAAIAKATGETK